MSPTEYKDRTPQTRGHVQPAPYTIHFFACFTVTALEAHAGQMPQPLKQHKSEQIDKLGAPHLRNVYYFALV
jgi:hypothetical protein